MRAAALSNEPQFHPGLFPALGAAISGLLGVVGLWVANRLVGRAAVKSAMDAGWDRFTNQLQEERTHWMELANKTKADFDHAVIAFEAERATLRGEVRNLMQLVESMKAILRANGIEVPEHRPRFTVENPPPSHIELSSNKLDDKQ